MRNKSNFTVLPYDFKASFPPSSTPQDLVIPSTRHSGLGFRSQDQQYSQQQLRHSLSLTKDQPASIINRDNKWADNFSSLCQAEQAIRSSSIDIVRWAEDAQCNNFAQGRKIKTKAQLDNEVQKLRSKISSVQRQDESYHSATHQFVTTIKKKPSTQQSIMKNSAVSSTKENSSLQNSQQKNTQININYNRIMNELPKENRINNGVKQKRQNGQSSVWKTASKQSHTTTDKPNSHFKSSKGKENLELKIGNHMIVIGGDSSLNSHARTSAVSTPTDKLMKMSLVSSVKSNHHPQTIDLQSKSKRNSQQNNLNNGCCNCSSQQKMTINTSCSSSSIFMRNEYQDSENSQCGICEKRRARRATISENIDRRKLSEGQKQFLKKHSIGNSSKENSSYKKQRDIRQRSTSFLDSSLFEQPCRSASMAATITQSDQFFKEAFSEERSFSVAPASSINSQLIIPLPETTINEYKVAPKKPFTYSISFASTPENQVYKNEKDKWDKSQKEFTDQELGDILTKGKQGISSDSQVNEDQIQTQTTQAPGSSALGGSSLSSFGLLTSSLGAYSSLSQNIPTVSSQMNGHNYSRLVYQYEERLREKEEQMTTTVKNYQQILASVTDECEKLRQEKEKIKTTFENEVTEERENNQRLNEEISKLREIEREKILLGHALEYKVIETDQLKEKINQFSSELKDVQTQITIKDSFIKEITQGRFEVISSSETLKIQESFKSSLDVFFEKLNSLQINKLGQLTHQDDPKRQTGRFKSEESKKDLAIGANDYDNLSTGFTQRNQSIQKSIVYEEEIQRLNSYIAQLKLNESKMLQQIASLESFLFLSPSSLPQNIENIQLLSARFQQLQEEENKNGIGLVSHRGDLNKLNQDNNFNINAELSLSQFASINDPHLFSQDSSRQTIQLQQLIGLNQFLQKTIEEQSLALQETESEVELLKQQNDDLRFGIQEFEQEVEDMKQIFTQTFENERANIISFYETKNYSDRLSNAAMCLQSIPSLTITQPPSAKKSQRVSAPQSQMLTSSSIHRKSNRKEDLNEIDAFGKSQNDTFEETYEDQRLQQIGFLSIKGVHENQEPKRSLLSKQACTFEEYLIKHTNQQNRSEEIFQVKEKELQDQINSIQMKCDRQVERKEKTLETSTFLRSSDSLSQSIRLDFTQQRDQIASLQSQIEALKSIKEQLAVFGKELNSKVNVQQLSDSAESLASLQEKQALNYISQIELERKIQQVQLFTNELAMELSTQFDKNRILSN